MEKTLQKIPFLRPVIALAVGIFFASKIAFPQLIPVLFFLATLGLLLFLNKYYKYRVTSIFGIGAYILFFLLGIITFISYNQKSTFYENGKYFATVLESPQKKENSYKSVLILNEFFNPENNRIIKIKEKILVYFEPDSSVLNLFPGDKIIFTQTPQIIENYGNPYEFDYKKYLELKKTYRQVYISTGNWKKTSLKNSFSLFILAERTRDRLLDRYRKQNLGENEFEILSALTLGYKRELDPEIKRVFSSAGAMHVLAVSGLHVGIIYWVLITFLGFLKNKKPGRFFFVLIAISCLWLYAFLTGLSPSVLRATTMFSFMVIGDSIKRTGNIYNSLAGSALILLIINPNNLFEVGFQLSYSAVFGIVYLQPKISQVILVKNPVLNYFWLLLTVSIAAQIATFPVSIFYFNQFPTYFFISNLFVIPAVFLLIPLGILLLFFSFIPLLSNGISFLVNIVLSSIYFLLKEIENLPFAVQKISLDPIELFFIISFLFSILLLLKKPRTIYLKLALICVLLLISTSFVKKIHSRNTNRIFVYNNSDNPVIHLISGKKNYVISEHKIENDDYEKSFADNTVVKLNLDPPLFLFSKTTFINKDILLKKDLILFKGKLIIIQKIPNDFLAELNLNPDFILNPIHEEGAKQYSDNSEIIITNKKYFPDVDTISNQVFNVTKQGAYQKKW